MSGATGGQAGPRPDDQDIEMNAIDSLFGEGRVMIPAFYGGGPRLKYD